MYLHTFCTAQLKKKKKEQSQLLQREKRVREALWQSEHLFETELPAATFTNDPRVP